MDYYINTNDDMQNDKDFFYHYNVFEYIQDFQIVFWKSDDALVVFVILDNNVYLYFEVYYKFSLLVYLFDKI